MTIAQSCAWVASLSSLTGTWLYGNRSKWGPVLGLIAEIPWLTMAYLSGLYGLVPATLAFTIIHARNLMRWRHEHTLKRELSTSGRRAEVVPRLMA